MNAQGWGRRAGAALLAAGLAAGISGCGGSADASSKPEKQVPETASAFADSGAKKDVLQDVYDARVKYLAAVAPLQLHGCPADCAKAMQKIIDAESALRTALEADTAHADYWKPATPMMDTLEMGSQLAADDMDANRPAVLGPGNKLYDWLWEHPVLDEDGQPYDGATL